MIVATGKIGKDGNYMFKLMCAPLNAEIQRMEPRCSPIYRSPQSIGLDECAQLRGVVE
jgi:hypothetical protein